MALSRMHVKAQSRCYTELRAEATPVAIWSGIVDFAHRQGVRDCGSLHKDHRLYTMTSGCTYVCFGNRRQSDWN